MLNFRHNVNKVCKKQFPASVPVFKNLPWTMSLLFERWLLFTIKVTQTSSEEQERKMAYYKTQHGTHLHFYLPHRKIYVIISFLFRVLPPPPVLCCNVSKVFLISFFHRWRESWTTAPRSDLSLQEKSPAKAQNIQGKATYIWPMAPRSCSTQTHRLPSSLLWPQSNVGVQKGSKSFRGNVILK